MTGKSSSNSKDIALLVISVVVGIALVVFWGMFWWNVFQIARLGRYRSYFILGGIGLAAGIVCMILQSALRHHRTAHDVSQAYDGEDAWYDDELNGWDEDGNGAAAGEDMAPDTPEEYAGEDSAEGYEEYDLDADTGENTDEAADIQSPGENAQPHHQLWLALRIVEGILVGLTAAAGICGVVWAATPYNGWLSLKLSNMAGEKKATYSHRNLYTDGVEAILTDISAAADLPSTNSLYIIGPQTIDYDIDGTVTRIDLQLASKVSGNVEKTYQISYREADGGTITVETVAEPIRADITSERAEDRGAGPETAESTEDHGTGTETAEGAKDQDAGTETAEDATDKSGRDQETFTAEMILQPFIDLSKVMDLSAESLAYESLSGQNHLQVVYYGYRSFDANEYTYYISQDGRRTHVAAADKDTAKDTEAKPCEGYEISLHSAGVDEIEPARYFATWQYQAGTR